MMVLLSYDHWRDVPPSEWKWPNFTPREIACRGSGTIKVSIVAMDKLQALRTKLDKPMVVHSAYRSLSHNRFVGGARDSLHMSGIAFDISMEGHDPHVFEWEARQAGFSGFGFYVRQNFMHIDTGPARVWGERFP